MSPKKKDPSWASRANPPRPPGWVDPASGELGDLALRLIRSARRLSEQGLSPGSSGSLSVRCGELMLITPEGSALSRVSARDLVAVRIGDGMVEGRVQGSDRGAVDTASAAPDGGDADTPPLVRHPAEELPIHLGLLRAARDVEAVVHLHSAAATAISCLPATADGLADLPDHTTYQVQRFPELPLVPYASPGSDALAQGVLDRLPGTGSVLVAHHGLVVTGASIEEAADLAEELDSACRVALLLAGRPGTTLDPQVAAALRGR